MTARDDVFDVYWTEEKDWLVEVVSLPKDEPEDEHDVTVDWIGRVFGFAVATNTRMLAQVGDPDVPSYELWFSFDSAENKKRFLDFVREDGYANPDEEYSFDPPPSLQDLPNLRPPSHVFPEQDAKRITVIGALTTQTIMEPSSTKPN